MSRSSWLRLLLGFVVVLSAAGGYALWVSTTRAAYLLRLGRAALEAGDWQQAEHFAERLAERGHRHHHHLLQGELGLRAARGHLSRGETAGPLDPEWPELESRAKDAFRQTLAELAQIRDEGPLAREATLLAAECLLHLGEPRFAVEALTAIVTQHPESKDAQQWLAAIYMDLNSPPDAIRHLHEWGRLDPADGRPYRWIGFFHRDHQRRTEAIEAYREALRRRLAPVVRAEVVRELVETSLAWEADYQGALGVLAECPEPFAKTPELLTLRAECLWGLGRPVEAAGLAETALQGNPNLSRALLLRGRMELTGDQPQAAVPFLEQAVALDAHDHLSREHLVQAYRQLGETARVEEHQRLLAETKALKEQVSKLEEQALARPWDDRIRQRIAGWYRQLNRPAEARMWLQAALACNPANQEAQRDLAQVLAAAGPPVQPFRFSVK